MKVYDACSVGQHPLQNRAIAVSIVAAIEETDTLSHNLE